MVKHLL